MNQNIIKFVAAALAFGVWGFFAFTGKTQVDGFITALSAALTGLGVHAVLPGKQ